MIRTEFESFLQTEVDKVKGIAYPVKAGLLRRLLVSEVPCSKLHPNPDDEFCFPEIGPNYEIISGYVSDYARYQKDLAFARSSVREPIEVERIRPDGYMILNGHHRWGAACKVGRERLRVRIVNLTQQKDIEKMLKSSRNRKRVSLDLDEVVFRPKEDSALEKPLPFPFSRIYRERLRKGIPALFQTMKRKGYDIWIYSARNYSVDYLQHYFLHYFVKVTGIVTGTARKGPAGTDTRKELEKRLSEKYTSTVHIDSGTVFCTFPEEKRFEEYRLSGNPETWSREVIEVFEKMRGK